MSRERETVRESRHYPRKGLPPVWCLQALMEVELQALLALALNQLGLLVIREYNITKGNRVDIALPELGLALELKRSLSVRYTEEGGRYADMTTFFASQESISPIVQESSEQC